MAVWIGFVLSLLVLAGSGVSAWWSLSGDAHEPPKSDPGRVPARDPAAGSATSDQTTNSSPASTRMTGEQALSALNAKRSQDASGLHPDDRWIAQLASKYDGVVDQRQTAAGGGHTFDLVDILDEHQGLAGRFGSQVKLLKGSDFGRQTQRSGQLWITVYDGGFGSRDRAASWCASSFPHLQGDDLDNSCLPRQVSLPHS